MLEVLVGVGSGTGVLVGSGTGVLVGSIVDVGVGDGSAIALPPMVSIIISPSVIRSEPTEPICINKSQLSVTELYVVKNP